MKIVTTVVLSAMLAVFSLGLGISSPARSIEFKEGTSFEMHRSKKEGWTKEKTNCVYTYKGVDEFGHRFTASSECKSPITKVWLHRETGEHVRWINARFGVASKNLEKGEDAFFLSGGPGKKWRVAYTDRWNNETRSGRWGGRCDAGDEVGGYYPIYCLGRIAGDGMTFWWEFLVSTKTGLWQRVVFKNFRGLEIIWEMTKPPQLK